MEKALEFIKTKDKLRMLIRIFSYLKPFFLFQFIVLIIVLISTLLSLSLPFFMKMLIDEVIIKQRIYLLGKIMIILITFLLFQILLSILHSYLTTILSNKITFYTNKEVYNHLLKLPIGYFSKSSAGETMSKIMNDINSLQNILRNFFVDVLFNVFSIIVIIGILLYLNVSLTIISLTIIPFFALSPKMFGKKLYEESKLIQERLAILTKFIQENISGIFMIKSFVKEKAMLERYKNLWREFLNFNLKRALRKTVASEIVKIFTFLGPIIVLWYGGWLTYKDELSIGGLIAFYSYVIKLYTPVSGLVNSQLNLHIAAAGIKRVFDFLDERTEESIDIVADEKIKIEKGSIKFIDVSFKFEDRNFLLSDLCFEVEGGTSLGIVGLSGSGKTSMINLLCKHYTPSKGKIEIDGYDLKGIPNAIVRKEVAIVPQEPFIFNGTILENLLFAKEDATMIEIEEACKIAQIQEFIMLLPRKYHTIVGDRGIALSSGQKQRIAIAMALLKDSKIFIMDEATSSIDPKTEKKLLDSLFQVLKGKTILIIAHRLSNLKYVDNIIILENGRIVEKGAKEELLKKRSHLVSYFESQYKLSSHLSIEPKGSY